MIRKDTVVLNIWITKDKEYPNTWITEDEVAPKDQSGNMVSQIYGSQRI